MSRAWIIQLTIGFVVSVPLWLGLEVLLVSTVFQECLTFDAVPAYPSLCELGTPLAYGSWPLIFATLLWLLPFRKGR